MTREKKDKYSHSTLKNGKYSHSTLNRKSKMLSSLKGSSILKSKRLFSIKKVVLTKKGRLY